MNKLSCIYLEDPRYIRKYDLRIAIILGETVATFIQQVHYHCVWKKERYGTLEWRASLSEWQKAFPNWSLATIKRAIKECRDTGVLKARKVVNPNGVAIWFSLDYDKLTEIGNAGAEKLEGNLAQNEPEVADAEAQNEPNPQLKMSLTPAQNEPHLVYPSSKATESSKIKGGDGKPSLVSAQTPNFLQDLQESVKNNNLESFRKVFAKKGSVPPLLKIWEILFTTEYDKAAYIAPSTKDKKNAAIFIEWCKESGTGPEDLLSWCITHWDDLRYTKMTWASLGVYPNLTTILGLKERFLEQLKSEGATEPEAKEPIKRVYTSVDQVPKDHKDYAFLKMLIEKNGKVEVL